MTDETEDAIAPRRGRPPKAAAIDGAMDDTATPAPTTIRMIRSPDLWPEPYTADVHPNEVMNMAEAGWVPER